MHLHAELYQDIRNEKVHDVQSLSQETQYMYLPWLDNKAKCENTGRLIAANPSEKTTFYLQTWKVIPNSRNREREEEIGQTIFSAVGGEVRPLYLAIFLINFMFSYFLTIFLNLLSLII